MSGHWFRKDERGVVVVWSAMFMFALAVLAGLAIDIGHWYLQASRIQRAADAAAMAGAARMPQGEEAIAAARETLSRNGYTQGGVVVLELTPTQPNRMLVTVTHQEVPTAFAKWVVPHIPITRSALAEYRKTVPMGSPFNVLGAGLNWPSNNASELHDLQNYMLAVNGYCAAKEDGDPRLSRYDGNKSETHTTCGAGGTLNPDYTPPTDKTGGYDFLIDVPGDVDEIGVEVLDPHFGPGLVSTGGLMQSYDVDLGRIGGDAPAQVTTTFKLFDTNGTEDPVQSTRFPGATDRVFGTLTTTQEEVGRFNELWRVSGVAGKRLRVNVTTAANQPRSWGSNTFGIMARTASGSWCDSRLHPDGGCPRVYGMDALPVQMLEGASALYLAEITPSAAGKKLEVSMFDPGEDADAARLLLPNGQAQLFTWEARPNLRSSSDFYSNLATESLDLSQEVLPADALPGVLGTAKFNDRMVTLHTYVPTHYANYTMSNTNYWWSIEYTTSGEKNLIADRTTWFAKLADGSPVRLIDQ